MKDGIKHENIRAEARLRWFGHTQRERRYWTEDIE